MLLIRSLLFQGLFYLSTLVLMIGGLPVFILPRRLGWPLVPFWARVNLFLLRWIVGLRVEYRGLGNIPRGGCIVAAKHQSVWETFALLPLFASPTYVLKRELRYIPLFGWYVKKMDMIAIDRGNRSQAIASVNRGAARAVAQAGLAAVIEIDSDDHRAGVKPKSEDAREIGRALLQRAVEPADFGSSGFAVAAAIQPLWRNGAVVRQDRAFHVFLEAQHTPCAVPAGKLALAA